MQIEIRADGAHISGYVNATEKKSRPVITPRGKVVEEIEPRAFQTSIDKGGNVTVNVDHDKTHLYASTEEGTLKLYEDNIGLHADVLITDADLIAVAKAGKIRGWSFGMYNVQDEMEEPRATGELPVRHIKALDLDHIALVVHKTPVYSATSVEVRAEDNSEVCYEFFATEDAPHITEDKPKPYANAAFRSRADALNK